MTRIAEKVQQIRIERAKYNLSIPEPIIADSITAFRVSFIERLGVEIDSEYLDFLNICDGLEEDGVQIYSSYNHQKNGTLYGIFENNELWEEHMKEFGSFIFFAESEQNLFIYNREMNVYELHDRYSWDVIKTFSTFNSMLLDILSLMLSEEVE